MSASDVVEIAVRLGASALCLDRELIETDPIMECIQQLEIAPEDHAARDSTLRALRRINGYTHRIDVGFIHLGVPHSWSQDTAFADDLEEIDNTVTALLAEARTVLIAPWTSLGWSNRWRVIPRSGAPGPASNTTQRLVPYPLSRQSSSAGTDGNSSKSSRALKVCSTNSASTWLTSSRNGCRSWRHHWQRQTSSDPPAALKDAARSP